MAIQTWNTIASEYTILRRAIYGDKIATSPDCCCVPYECCGGGTPPQTVTATVTVTDPTPGGCCFELSDTYTMGLSTGDEECCIWLGGGPADWDCAGIISNVTTKLTVCRLTPPDPPRSYITFSLHSDSLFLGLDSAGTLVAWGDTEDVLSSSCRGTFDLPVLSFPTQYCFAPILPEAVVSI